MASPFVPVDLDKLLDEFEEKEEETKPEQLASSGTTDTDGNLFGRQRFQAPFPSIEKEVLSDQGSDRHISGDKSNSDNDSDNDSVIGIIQAAEAITKQESYQSQNTQGLLLDNFKQNVVVAENAPSENLNGSSAYLSTVKDSNCGSIELDEEKHLNQYGYSVHLEDEETEALSVSSELYACKEMVIPSDNSCCMEKEVRNSTDVIASSVLYSETSPELNQEQTSSHSADQERYFRDGDKYITEQAGVDDISTSQHSTHELIDLNASLGDPGMSNTRVAAKSEMEFTGESSRSLEELTTHRPGLDLNQVPHGPGMHKEQVTNDSSYHDGHSAEQYAFGELINQCDTLGITTSTSEPNETPVQTMLSGTFQDQDDNWYLNANINGEPNVTSQDPSQAAEAGGPVASNILIAFDSEVNQVPGSETQAVYDNQAGVSSDLSHHVSSQGEPSTDYDALREGNNFDAVSPPISNELEEQEQSRSLSPELDLTITMHSQGSLEARRITSGEANLGKVPPIWVPDSVATHCMNCGVKFSVIKRRHHCRACGKALCSSCCNMKFLLPYMDNKEGRVCQVCCNVLLRAQALLQVVDNQTNENIRSEDESPTDDLMLDDGLEEEDEQVDEQVEQEIPENAEAVPDVPEDTTDLLGAEVDLHVASGHTAPVLPPLQLPVSPPQDMGDTPLATPTSPALSDDSDCLFRLDVDNVRSLLPQDITALPPVLKVSNEEISIQERPDPAEIMYQIKGLHETVVFLLNKNLVVKVSIVKLSCCVKRKCWCFVTEGMGAANQEEMVVLLECLRKETMLPKDVLSHFNTAFAYAKQGHTVSELGYTIFGQPFLGSSDNAGFLYIKPTYQCLKKLPLPSTPYVVGILIKRQETPWAQLFPLRLQLRLGAEYRYYPCPLFSSRNRSSVYGEVGHTIMNLLADFKNFQYTLARVTGLVIHMEEKKTLVRLPQDRYDEVVKILNATDEHVMALGANFSLQADSHLVCIQSEQGYKTQAINIQNQPRKVTGASFIVFSGAMKSSSPFMAKVNIVEDGIMVQLMPEAIAKLRNSLKEMKDYTITTGIPGGGGEEQVIVEWVSRKDAPCQSSLCSPIDGLQLDGFSSVKVHCGYDFTRKTAYRIQWTEMFFLGDGQQSASRDLNKLTAELAKAFGRTLMAHLPKLSSDNCTFIGLRVNLDSENVGYFTGSNQESLPANIMSDLDDVLVPVLHAAAGRHRGRALSVELLFKILRLL